MYNKIPLTHNNYIYMLINSSIPINNDIHWKKYRKCIYVN